MNTTPDSIVVPLKVIRGKKWLSFMHLFPKATIRAIGMEAKPKRVQDEGKHHCYEIKIQGNIRLRPKIWKVS